MLYAPQVGLSGGALPSGSGAAPTWGGLYVPAELSVEVLDDFCELLVRDDVRYLRTHGAPYLYRSGAFYRPQPEYWLSIPWAILAVRVGMGLDCKTLACWRAAELRVHGSEPGARCLVTKTPTHERDVYHVRVIRQDGSVEDPSAALGMNSVLGGGGYGWYPPGGNYLAA